MDAGYTSERTSSAQGRAIRKRATQHKHACKITEIYMLANRRGGSSSER